MTYGGVQSSGGLGQVAAALSASASSMEAISAPAGFEANFQRRGEDWALQADIVAVLVVKTATVVTPP